MGMAEDHHPDTRTAGLEPPSAEGLPGGVVEVELAQGLGLAEALTIGVGTMIGAGIFVLPGIIISRTGPAAVLAFLLGGAVAMLSAMSAAEVATGMPKSGGGYYFISRAMGPLWGAIIGWGSWAGLIFASAFYMVGFGEYVHTFTPIPPLFAALAVTALLVALNLVGSQAAGKAQNLTVGILIVSLVLFGIRGAFDVDLPMLFGQELMPKGLGAVAAGTATLFVTYCGFGEIASMAEEVRQPGRNLPRALLYSVAFVTALYCVLLLVCVGQRPWGELSGSTLVADLAEDMMGRWGRGVILCGAIMAMLSATNASIMSAARISFAMGRDQLVWSWMNAVHPRFRVPHIAILATGGLITATILIQNVELLAEAAGLLHLLLYGLICVACIILRAARLEGYSPAYRVPLYPLVPVLGAVGCFTVAFFMKPVIFAGGVAVIAFAVVHYYWWGRRRTALTGAWPYSLRRGLLEPALVCVERWGARPDVMPTALVAVENPGHEPARLQLAAAIMGPRRGEVLVTNVFVADFERQDAHQAMAGYYETIALRNRALETAAAPLLRAGARVKSHVPVANSVFCGVLSAAQASGASIVFLGWPDESHSYAGTLSLVGAFDEFLHAHLLVFREEGPVPASRLLGLVDDSMHGDLALLCATRLANAWDCRLSVASVLPEDASDEQLAEVEGGLDMRVSDLARTSVRAVRAESLGAVVAAESRFTEMIITGVLPGDGPRVTQTIEHLENAHGCSLVLVRASDETRSEADCAGRARR